MTAEFAITLPVVIIVLGIIVGALTLAAQRITLTSAAHEIARLEARGDAHSVAQRLLFLTENTQLQRETSAGLHCVILNLTPENVFLRVISVTARGCAAT